MAESRQSYRPPWQSTFLASDAPDKPSCLYCGCDEGVVLVGQNRRDVGVCEPCAAHVHFVWRLLTGDAPPKSEPGKKVVPTRVKLVFLRLKTLADGKTASPAAADSYEVGLVVPAKGKPDLPTTDLVGSETEGDAVSRLCKDLLVSTWPNLVEPLYVAYTPRGRLVRVFLITAYAEASIVEHPRLSWRAWPVEQWVDESMREFYCGFRDVFGLRVWKHQGQEPRTSGMTTLVREGAARYIRMQQKLRVGVKDEDTSMAEYWRKSMSDDEKLVDRWVREHDEEVAARLESEKRSKDGPRDEPASGEQLALPAAEPPAEISTGQPPEDPAEDPAETGAPDDEITF